MRNGHTLAGRVFRARGVALAMGIAVLAAGCGSGGAGKRAASEGATGDAATAPVAITPASGTGDARPDQGISLAAAGRSLGTVQVTANGKPIEGELDAGGARWRSRWPLAPGRAYDVTATATAAGGKVTTVTSRFTTAQAARTVHASVTGPGDGATVGVGMPIMLNFSQPVYNKAQIERALEVRTSTPVQGAWRWMDAQRIVFRPRTYWPVGTRVDFTAHLNGARAAKGVYATENLSLNFTIGDAVISTVDTKKYTMTVRRNGKVVRRFPMSAGKGTERRFTTTGGIHVISEKVSPVIFDSTTVGIPKGDPNYYKIKGYYADRISDSGEYVHSAPWSVADQGKRNVSHGCINISPANAKWYYTLTKLGDIVVVTGTDRKLEPDNGYGFFQMSWPTWTAGSALKRSITTTPLKPNS
jgi:lipoprotein-anchoring transpeptidase ErfK/SrfK